MPGKWYTNTTCFLDRVNFIKKRSMFYKLRFYTSAIFILFLINGFSQNKTLEKLPQEKVLLTTDRTIYFAGEQIWLKTICRLTAGTDSLSRVMYVELLDKKAKPVVQKKIRVINGLSTGVIEVPEDILTGVYYIRAYTQYMRNFEKELFYTTELTIINADLPAKEIIQTIAKDTVVDEKSGLVQINMPSAVFIPNASVEVELTGKESKEVSVSVVKKGSYESNKVGIHKFYKISAADAEKKLK